MKHSSRFLELVERLRADIQTTDVHQVLNRLNTDQPFLLIDVREASEWVMGHLPKAVHMSKGTIERDIEKNVPDVNTPMILYCGGGFRSTLAAYNLQQMGYTQVVSMDGGFSEWVQCGYPIVVSNEAKK